MLSRFAGRGLRSGAAPQRPAAELPRPNRIFPLRGGFGVCRSSR